MWTMTAGPVTGSPGDGGGLDQDRLVVGLPRTAPSVHAPPPVAGQEALEHDADQRAQRPAQAVLVASEHGAGCVQREPRHRPPDLDAVVVEHTAELAIGCASPGAARDRPAEQRALGWTAAVEDLDVRAPRDL